MFNIILKLNANFLLHYKDFIFIFIVFTLFMYFFICLLNEVVFFTQLFNEVFIKTINYFSMPSVYDAIIKLFSKNKNFYFY
jgi:hypothetical protein